MWRVHVCMFLILSVCLLVKFVSPAKTAEQVKMPFGGLSDVESRNHMLDAGTDFPRGKRNFRGLSAPLKSVGNLCSGVRKKS